jgi:hypothetical protein
MIYDNISLQRYIIKALVGDLQAAVYVAQLCTGSMQKAVDFMNADRSKIEDARDVRQLANYFSVTANQIAEMIEEKCREAK